MNFQTTIASPVSISGKGLHTGQQVTVTLEPAPADSGIRFMRTDIPECPIVKACPENVFDTSRGTAIKDGAAEVYTIEHLMAAQILPPDDRTRATIHHEVRPLVDK